MQKTGTDVTEREVFNEWFMSLLTEQSTCLFRDILRDSKETMWQHWQERKPVDMDVINGGDT